MGFLVTIFVSLFNLHDRNGLLSKSAGKVRSDAQKATLLENRAALLHQIEKWHQIQAVYMPSVIDTDTTDVEPSQRVKAESVKLWLPSQLVAEDRDAVCLSGVASIETELRLARLEDSLDDLR